ncbi:trigger factor-like protein TIG, Chloroplastic [Dorcoceras hygrometricum]|uniref:Trigger factor-like protein TIG, Chloroplastic n=1 Tax=Dorcoceras hygrometricum TaxID=472368 RepID=A0A2Z7CSN3_9LAMI|nr:trigger factor-like protein TIG, Chloroplastic [Dorcoceras hygrometricum]
MKKYSMADGTDEIFDFSNLEFTCEDLLMTLNDMVHEYKKLSQSFEEVKAERRAVLIKLSWSQEMLNENQRLAEIIRSYTKSSASLDKLHGAMKPSGDRSRLGYARDSLKRHTDEIKIAAKPSIWQGRFCGLGYNAPEKPRESWLKKRVEQLTGKPKSGGKSQDSSRKLLRRKCSTGLI